MLSRKLFVISSCLAVVALLAASCAPTVAPALTPKPAQPAARTPDVETPASKISVPTPTNKPAAAQPSYGGVLDVSSVGDPPSLDSHQETSMNTYLAVAPAYNQVLEYKPQVGSGLFPGLAESWDISKDGLIYTFNIRKGVKFHDGSSLTANDVAYSLTRLWRPPRGIRTALAGLLEPIKSIEATENQVKITLDYPYSTLVHPLARTCSVIYPQRVVEAKGDMKNTVVGTGPFRFKSYTPGVSVELVKNPDYWTAGRPYLDRAVYYILKDSMTRLAALRTGRVKMTGRGFASLTPSEMETVKRDRPEIVSYPSASPLYPFFFMNIRAKPFDDKRVRKAVSLSIDRRAAIEIIAQGQGLSGRIFALEGWGIPDDERSKLPGYRVPKDADIDEAKKLMADAGYPQGFKLSIWARTMAISKDSALFMTGQVSKIGIEAKVDVLEDVVFWDRARLGQHQAMVYTPSMSMPDVENLGRFFAKGGANNFSGNDDDEKLNALWEKQRRTLDENQRKAIVREVEQYILEEAQPLIPLVVPSNFLVHWPEVRNFYPGTSEYGTNNLQEIWIAK